MIHTIGKMIQMERMKEKQFICRGENQIYVIDKIDKENKKMYLVSATDDGFQSAICLGFDEIVYDEISDGNSVQKAWILAGVQAMPINLDCLLKYIERK